MRGVGALQKRLLREIMTLNEEIRERRTDAPEAPFEPFNGNLSAPVIAIQSGSLRARVTHLLPELGVQIANGDGDNLRQISYKTPEPIPRADPEGKGRTIGQRVDEMIAEAEGRAVRDYQKAQEERQQA